MVLESPTKSIREGLEGLSLNRDQNKENIHNENNKHKGIGSKKNLLQPTLVPNSNFEELDDSFAYFDNKKTETDDITPDDTVIHNTSTIATPPDYLRFKKQQPHNLPNRAKESINSVPSLTQTVTTAPTIHVTMDPTSLPNNSSKYGHSHNAPQSKDENILNRYDFSKVDNTQLDNMIRDHADVSFVFNAKDMAEMVEPTPVKHITNQISLNGDDFSFRGLDEDFRVISDYTNSTSKTMSYPSSKQIIEDDSPLVQAKFKDVHQVQFIRSKSKSSWLSPKVSQQNSSDEKLNLITPIEEGMLFDEDAQKWVYDDSRYNLDQKCIDNLTLRLNDPTPEKIQTASNKPTITDNFFATPLRSESMNDSRIDYTALSLQNVTDVFKLDLSYNAVKSNLISVLHSKIDRRTNWGSIPTIDLSNQQLISVESLDFYLPSLIEVRLDNNKISSLNGISSCLKRISLDDNEIDDKSLTFNQDQYGIEYLSMNNNGVTSFLEFQALRNLRVLKLSNNKVQILRSLPTVEILDLSNNSISGDLDFKGFNFGNLKHLDLSGNKITAVRNLNLPNLAFLDLHNNSSLTRIEMPKDLKSLEKIDLLGCRNLPKFTAKNVPNLKVLFAEGSIQLDGKLFSLVELKIHNGYGLSDLLQNPKLQVNKQLLQLTMNNCQIKNIKDLTPIYYAFPYLKKIDLANNQITGTYKDLYLFLSKLKDIKGVEMKGNPIRECFRGTDNLVVFDYLIHKILCHEY